MPYGFSNCALMADLAFLEALALEIPAKISYIRFVNNKDPKIEIVNAIAIGNFPKKNECFIISPWEDKYYRWQGSVKDTPELNSPQVYNDYKILITVNVYNKNDTFSFQGIEIPKRDYFKQRLQEIEYANWSRLLTKHKLVQSHCDGFNQFLVTYGFKQRTKKLEQPLLKQPTPFFKQEICCGPDVNAQQWPLNKETTINEDRNGPGYGF